MTHQLVYLSRKGHLVLNHLYVVHMWKKKRGLVFESLYVRKKDDQIWPGCEEGCLPKTGQTRFDFFKSAKRTGHFYNESNDPFRLGEFRYVRVLPKGWHELLSVGTVCSENGFRLLKRVICEKIYFDVFNGFVRMDEIKGGWKKWWRDLVRWLKNTNRRSNRGWSRLVSIFGKLHQKGFVPNFKLIMCVW